MINGPQVENSIGAKGCIGTDPVSNHESFGQKNGTVSMSIGWLQINLPKRDKTKQLTPQGYRKILREDYRLCIRLCIRSVGKGFVIRIFGKLRDKQPKQRVGKNKLFRGHRKMKQQDDPVRWKDC